MAASRRRVGGRAAPPRDLQEGEAAAAQWGPRRIMAAGKESTPTGAVDGGRAPPSGPGNYTRRERRGRGGEDGGPGGHRTMAASDAAVGVGRRAHEGGDGGISLAVTGPLMRRRATATGTGRWWPARNAGGGGQRAPHAVPGIAPGGAGIGWRRGGHSRAPTSTGHYVMQALAK